jgi:hypothetical protein
MKIIIIIALLTTTINAKTPQLLVKRWESTPNLSVPESVIYDERKNVIYCSNVNNSKSPWKNNNGFISKLNTNGETISTKWATGLKAPKGLALNGNFLYVCDLNTIAKIDTKDGNIVATFQAPKRTKNLNDLSYDKNQNLLYASDSSDKQIFKVTTDGKFTLVYDKEDGKKARQNGVFIYNKQLIMQGKKGYLKSLDPKTNKTTIISTTINTSIDGISNYKNQGFIVSNWGGKIFFISNDGTTKLLLKTKPTKSADISYELKLGLLLVPNFDDKIIAYEVK